MPLAQLQAATRPVVDPACRHRLKALPAPSSETEELPKAVDKGMMCSAEDADGCRG